MHPIVLIRHWSSLEFGLLYKRIKANDETYKVPGRGGSHSGVFRGSAGPQRNIFAQRVKLAQRQGRREGAVAVLQQLRERYDALSSDKERRRAGMTHRPFRASLPSESAAGPEGANGIETCPQGQSDFSSGTIFSTSA